MRKHILILLMLLCSSIAFGQNKTLYAWARTTDTAYTSGSWRLDSVMRALYYATNDTNKVLGINAQGYIVLRTKTTGGGGSTDTTSLSNRIDARVKYTDTVAMLLPYARKTLVADTAAAIRASIPSVTGKVNYTDTAAMLSPYYRTAVATVALAAKQAYADTTTWDATKKNLADTAAVLRGLIPTGVDTTSLSNRIDARVKYTDTAAMLSPYALTSELTNQTGADGSLKSLTITGTNGLGHIHLRHQAVDATATGQSTTLFADVNGDLKWKNDGNFYTTFRDYLNTADRVYSFQNKNYTVADSADVASKLNISDTASMLSPYLRTANAPIAHWYYSDDTLRNDSTHLLMRNTSTTIDAVGRVSITSQDEFNVATPSGSINLISGANANITAPNVVITGGNSLQSSTYVNDNGLVVPSLGTEPTGESGALYYNTVDDILYTYQNLAWVPVVGTSPTVADVAETNAGTDNDKFVSPLGLAGSDYLDQSGSKVYATTGGVANTYTLTLVPAITSYTTGQTFNVIFNLANTNASTININGLGAKSLVKNASSALVSGDLITGKVYIIFYNGTNFQVTNVGGNISGTGGPAYTSSAALTSPALTTPTVVTSIVGSATFAAFNTTTTNLSLGGATTTMTIGGTPTTAITHTYSGNATATATIKAVNIATGGASGSTTNLGFGSATSGATNNFTFNRLLTSGSTNDSLVVIDPTTGALKRISSARIGGTSGPDTSAWHKGGDATASDRSFGTTSNFSVDFLVNNTRAGRLATSATNNVGFGLLSLNPANSGTGNTAVGGNAMGEATNTGGNNSAFGYAALARITTGSVNVGVGYQAGLNIATGQNNVSIGYQTQLNNTGGSNNVAIGTSAYTGATSGDNNIIIGYNQQAPSSTGSNQLNLQGGLFGVGLSGSSSSPAGRFGIGTNAPNASALLDLTSTSQGLLLPRLTTAQVNAIASPAAGLTVYNTDLNQICFYNGSAWQKVTNSAM